MGAKRITIWSLAIVIILCALTTIAGVALAAAVPTTDFGDSERDALQGTISLLHWALITVGVGLTGAIALLWRSCQAKDTAIINEVKASATIREEFVGELRANREARESFREKLETVERKIEYCKPRREREEVAVDSDGVK